MEHPFIKTINGLEEKSPSMPWEKIGSYTIHALLAAGYAPDSDLILVITAFGNEVFDGLTGEIIAWLDTTNDNNPFFDEVHLTARGIGPLEGQNILVASWDYGGGLTKQTADGWQIKVYSFWPNDVVILLPEKSSEYFDPSTATKLFGGEREIVTAGFSETGKSFIIAEPSAITIYARD